MSYKATIVRITTRPHPSADRLQLADAGGYTCIIGLDHVDGELGIVFPEGGQLAHDFCMVNGLYRKDPGTGLAMGGYLEATRRIRALKLRKVESNALWLPMSALYCWLGQSAVLEEGQELDEIGGRSLCGKYYTAATIRLMRSANPKSRKEGRLGKALDRHYDTPQLRNAQLPHDGRVIITEKLHGTSGRTGKVMVDDEQWWITKQINKLPWIHIKPRQQAQMVSGTRNCIVDSTATGEKSKGFRVLIHNLFSPELLATGEVWYYEIVGFEEGGAPIMGQHTIGEIGDSKIEKRLKREVGGDAIIYGYGNHPHGRLPGDLLSDMRGPLRFMVYVYRIALDGHDLPFRTMVNRVNRVCSRMHDDLAAFIDVVPLLADYDPGAWSEGTLRDHCDVLTRGASTLPHVPVREGVCVRIETVVDTEVIQTVRTSEGVEVHRHRKGDLIISKSLKHKSWLFCSLEGISRNDPDFVDTEEIA